VARLASWLIREILLTMGGRLMERTTLRADYPVEAQD